MPTITDRYEQPQRGSNPSVSKADRLEQLRELDGQIMQNADDLTRRIQRREKPAALSVIANLLRSMFDRRAYMLTELKKAGVSEAEAYREINKPCGLRNTDQALT